jgi:hypothetical protein
LDQDLAPKVITHAGYSGSDHPQIICWQGIELRVTHIIKEWREPGSKHYLVETGDKQHFSLTFLEMNAEWLVSPVHLKTKC